MTIGKTINDVSVTISSQPVTNKHSVNPQPTNEPKSKREAKRQQRRPNRRNTNNDVVANALLAADQQRQGENDAKNTKQQEQQVKYHYYVSKLALFHGVNRSNHIIEEREHGAFVSGNFSFPGDKETVSINRVLPYSPSFMSEPELSNDLILIRTISETGNAEVDLENYINSLRIKLKEILITIVDTVDMSISGNYNSIQKAARAAFLRYNRIYPSLNNDIFILYHTEDIQKVYQQKAQMVRGIWRPNTINKCTTILAQRGYDFEQEFARFRVHNNMGDTYNFKLYSKVNVVLASLMIPATLIKPLLSIPLAISGILYNLYKYYTFKPVSFDDALRSYEKFLNPNHHATLFAPCATAYLERTRFSRDMPEIKTPGLKLNLLPGLERPDKDVHTYGTFINAPCVYPSQDRENLEAAIRMRLATTDFGNKSTQRELVKYARKFIKNLPVFELPAFTPEQNLTFLQDTYGNKKGLRYFQLADEELTSEHLQCDMFVKNEVYLGKTPQDFKPRMIFARHPIIIAKFGIYFNYLGKLLKQHFNSDNDIYYTASSTPSSLGVYFDRMNSNYPFRYESDVSSWDGALSPDMIDIELIFLNNRVVGMPSELEYLKKNWKQTKAEGCNGQVKLSMEHGRRSGDLWTSMFNSLLNIIITHFIVNKIEPTARLGMMVMGDDNGVWVDRAVDTTAVETIYRDLGMKCEVVVSDDDHFSFCSGLFYKTAFGSIWGVKPFRQMAKLGLNPKGFPPNLHQRLLYGTALSMLSTGGHVPILGAFLRAIVNSSSKSKIKPFYNDNWAERIKDSEETYPDCETYAQFSYRYGVSKDEVMFVENWIIENININNFPLQCVGKIFLDGFDVDVADHTTDGPYNILDSLVIDSTDPLHEITQVIPLQEEMQKLNPESLYESIVNAQAMGIHEDQMLGTTSHRYLHVLFTVVSFFNLPLGVRLHGAYNRFAMQRSNIHPCATPMINSGKSKKSRPGVQRRSQPKGLVKGPGFDVVDAVKKVAALLPRGSLAAAGMAAGGALGGAPGAALGGSIGRAISTISGYGDYEIKENSLIATGDRAVSAPSFGSESTVIRHREFVRDIPASGTAFTNFSFSINPGLSELFPWLSQFANSYDQYQILGMVVEFNSTFSDITAGGNLGTVMIATDYDATDDAYPNKITLENAMFSCSAKPSLSLIHAIECDPTITFSPIKYLRKGSIPSGTDARLYDWGNLQLATQNLPVSTGSIGELWVTYEIAFYKPQLAPPLCRTFDYFQLPQTVSASHYLGADTTTIYYGTSGSSLGGYATNSTYYFPTNATGSKYMINLMYRGAATTITTQLTLSDTNCTLTTDFYGNGTGCTPHGGYGAPQSGALACSSTMVNYTYVVDADGASITVSAGTLPGTLFGADLFVLQYA